MREVDKAFTRSWRIRALGDGDQVVRTTAEHPFFVEVKGRPPTATMEVGDCKHGVNLISASPPVTP